MLVLGMEGQIHMDYSSTLKILMVYTAVFALGLAARLVLG